MNHNVNSGQYTLFDDDSVKSEGFPLQPIEGGGEQPAKTSDAWEDVGNRQPYNGLPFEQQLALDALGTGNRRQIARIKSHLDDMQTPGMVSSITELNPPEITDPEMLSRIRAAKAIGRVLFHDTLNENKHRKR